MSLLPFVKRFGSLLMILATIMLISLLYPSSVKFKYEFQKGQVWGYNDLEAPFDFAIKKSIEEWQADKTQVSQDFSPYYRLNPELMGAKIRDFEAVLEQYLKAQPVNPGAEALKKKLQEHLRDGKVFLEMVYKRGIIQLAPEHQGKGNDFVINLVEGNISQKRTLPGFFTPEQVQQMLVDSLAKERVQLPSVLKRALQEVITANVVYDAEMTEKMREQALSAVASTKGVVRQGDVIVKKGTVITDDIFEKLISFRTKYEKDVIADKSSSTVFTGYLLLTALILGTFMMYVNAYRSEIYRKWNQLAFILTWLLSFSYLTFLVEHTEGISIYVIPYCIVPVVVRHFFTYRLAFFTHVVVILIAGFLTQEGFPFIFSQIVAGVVAVLAVADARNWSRFFGSVLSILLAYALARLGLSLVEEGSLMAALDWHLYGWLLLNGLLTLLAFPLISLSERLFGFTSTISLVELSDMNRPLLRHLAIKAPGTVQHSLQVGNLAEAVAQQIGADALLVRVGALYHDIGKMHNPEFFIENQSGRNPHENHSALESAQIIIEHITEGEKLAKKYGLPSLLTRFITTHHGTTKVEFFYKTFLMENPGMEVEDEQFTYPGPKPRSREEAILMLADSVEATSRSLKAPSGEDIDNLVDKIVNSKIDQGQLNKSSLTFGDIEVCKRVFKKMLRSIHHVRIEYPE